MSAPKYGSPKYGSALFVDAMRQAALGKWMRYLGSASEIEEAFGFAPADASERYYGALAALGIELATALAAAEQSPIAVLDVGAGIGRIAYDVARASVVERVVALDRSPALLHEIAALAAAEEREVCVPVTAKKALQAVLRPPVATSKLRAVNGDAHDLPFADAEFSLVFGLGLLDRVERPAAVASELARVLKPGGVAVVSCLHDFAGGPASAEDWPGSAAELFAAHPWTSAEPRRHPLDLRQNAHYVVRINAEIVIARRA